MIIVGGGGREDDIAFCMTFVIWELDGHQDVWKRDLLCKRIDRKDLKISMREGIGEDPNVQEVYDVQMVHMKDANRRRPICLIWECEEKMREVTLDIGDIRWQMELVRLRRVEVIWQWWKRWGMELMVDGHQGQKWELGEILMTGGPTGRLWWDIFHNKSDTLWG